MKQYILKTLSKIIPAQTAYGHCDYPCGIYDPHGAIVAALTVIRMVDLLHEHEDTLKNPGHHSELELRNNIIRAVAIKEKHAEHVKHEIRVIWGDYFKPELKAQSPGLDPLVFSIMQLASKAKQNVDRSTALELLNSVNKFAEIFWQSKGKETKRVRAPYKPEEEIVIPIL